MEQSMEGIPLEGFPHNNMISAEDLYYKEMRFQREIKYEKQEKEHAQREKNEIMREYEKLQRNYEKLQERYNELKIEREVEKRTSKIFNRSRSRSRSRSRGRTRGRTRGRISIRTRDEGFNNRFNDRFSRRTPDRTRIKYTGTKTSKLCFHAEYCKNITCVFLHPNEPDVYNNNKFNELLVKKIEEERKTNPLYKSVLCKNHAPHNTVFGCKFYHKYD